jgi:hypothetical protein
MFNPAKNQFQEGAFPLPEVLAMSCEHAAVLYGCLPSNIPNRNTSRAHCFSNNRRTVPKVLWATLKTLAWGERR